MRINQGIVVLILTLLTVGFAGPAGASVKIIGTATYDNQQYNLIYEDADPFLVWLDFQHDPPGDRPVWSEQIIWGLSLNTALTNYNFDPGYNMALSWGLPTKTEIELLFTDITASNNYAPFTSVGGGNWPYFWSSTENPLDNTEAWFHFLNGNYGFGPKTNGSNALAVAHLVVPEPSTYLLLCLSLCVVGYTRRRLKVR